MLNVARSYADDTARLNPSRVIMPGKMHGWAQSELGEKLRGIKDRRMAVQKWLANALTSRHCQALGDETRCKTNPER